ncbi:MAG: hypothetical protein AAFX51_19045 [Cyanobacteria bacterium J06636_28]
MTSAVTPPKTHYNRRQQSKARRAVRFQTAAVVPPIASPTQQSAPKTSATAPPNPRPTLVTLLVALPQLSETLQHVLL